jgi:hypothetical membrane protein
MAQLHMTRSTTRALLGCGVLAGPLFVLVFLIEGATRAGYDPLRHPVSSLALGPYGWLQTINFLVVGALYLAFAVGLWRAPRSLVRTRLGVVLLGAAALGMLGAGLFTTDPVSGYPPGSKELSGYTTTGALHDLVSVPTFLGLPLAALVFAGSFLRSGNRAWALYSAATGVVMLVAFWLASGAFAQQPGLVDFGGLFQRAVIVTGFAWQTALAVRTRQALPDR